MKKLQTIKVADIAEYPTMLGNRCRLLNELKVDPYKATEEEIMAILEKTAKDSKNLDICKRSSRCGAFFDKYSKGITPFLEKDQIRLEQFNGKYWVSEGKHRCCMAKRMGVKAIQAYVLDLSHDEYSILPTKNNADTYLFSHAKRTHGKIVSGDLAALWVKMPYNTPPVEFAFNPIIITARHDTKGKWQKVFDGLAYKVIIKRKKFFWQEVAVIIKIGKNHSNTRIWVASMNIKQAKNRYCIPIREFDVVYRHGCWRNFHASHKFVKSANIYAKFREE